MSNADLKARYDEFQSDAVRAVVGDFQQDAMGRFLLVIPTGGGKTYTAVKSVCAMYAEGFLSPEHDRVLWVAHRTELISQARDTFESVIGSNALTVRLDKEILVEMVTSSKSTLKTDRTIKLIVIDEAHHAAAKSYLPIFEQERAGVLGLTATPSRHDGLPLDFHKESYSIGFPDLVKRGIILRPHVHEVQGGIYDFDSFLEDDLEQLNDAPRNQRIIGTVLENKDIFQKVIIYVGTKTHAKDLYEYLKSSKVTDHYESISYITGDGNSRFQERSDFIAQEKIYKRSILVNVQVLSEGYDDPAVNTVVMAAPSNSKLYYMQALGRAIRQNPENTSKQAHVVEVIDELPNIRYRIDNRWLFSDISDALEPEVIDREYSSEADLTKVLDDVYSQYAVKEVDKQYPVYTDKTRYSLLLFKQYAGENDYRHTPVLIDNDNRLQISNAYNFLSERMKRFVTNQYNAHSVFRMIDQYATSATFSENERRLIYDAMSNAYHAMQPDCDGIPYIEPGRPWITFASMNYKVNDQLLDEDLLDFIADMVNRDEVHERLVNRDFEPGEVLVRLPLPLRATIGLFVTPAVGDSISTLVSSLRELRDASETDQIGSVESVIQESILPIETKYANSLVMIARDDNEYCYILR